MTQGICEMSHQNADAMLSRIPLPPDFPAPLRRCHERAMKLQDDIAVKCNALEEESTYAVFV